MSDAHLADLEKLFLALSDRTRMRLLALMAEGEVSVGYLADTLRQSQPKISRHLAYLRNMGIVSTRRDGKWIYYAIDADAPSSLARILYETLSVIQNTPVRTSLPQRRQAVSPEHIAESLVVEPAEFQITEEPEVNDHWEPQELDVFLL
jgi:DNA-binding transcriptional ArsR family regulator